MNAVGVWGNAMMIDVGTIVLFAYGLAALILIELIAYLLVF